MPIYNYICSECGHQLKILAKMSDPPETTCPNCHQESLKRQIGRTAFQLKGGGWYEQGYSGTSNSSASSSSGDD